MRAKPASISSRKLGASLLSVLAAGWLCGCFALFSLDGYGPPGDIIDGATNTDGSPDAREGGAADASVPARTVFVTGEAFLGNLGGLAGADAKCQAAAGDAGLKGSYRAWLSDNTASAADRIGDGGAPLRLPNGTLVAATAAELSTTGPRTGIVVDPRGKAVDGGACDGGFPVWTGTSADGGATKPDCMRWSTSDKTVGGVAGAAGGAGALWTTGCAHTCGQVAGLYCIGD